MWKDWQFEMSLYYWEILTPEEKRELKRRIVQYVFQKQVNKVGKWVRSATGWGTPPAEVQPRLQQSESRV